jgi:uncharacterized protein YjbI with pentapeptide repeats
MDAKIIGSKIAKARKAKDLSQAELAGLLFISPQAVGKWERGESIPDIVTVNKLAEILGVDLNYFSENFRSGNDETAFNAVAFNGDTGQTGQIAADPSSTQEERRLLTSFSGGNLSKTDFAGVTAHKQKFNGSALHGSDFTGADLTGSTFSGSDIREANFDGANLTDCTFSADDLTDARFNNTILVRTKFSSSAMDGVKFTGAELINGMLATTDLKKTLFQNCVFNGMDFKSSDLSGVCFDGNTFIGVKFQKTALTAATFNGATLRNVSFRPGFALTNKYYKMIQTICFDGAAMDKLTYAELKSMGAELSKVTFI